MRFYWCVNCGNHGDFGFYRARGVKCQECQYDELTELDESEYNDWYREFGKHQENASGQNERKSNGTTKGEG